MRIVAISDTHERHHQVLLPEGDMLIHAGDWTNKGTEKSMVSFLEWFGSQPHTHKILIPGNHELSLDSLRKDIALEFVQEKAARLEFHFLLNSSVEIEGFKIYGTPTTPLFYNWAFNFQRGPEIAKEWAKIPLDTNILVTHGPPYNILDLVEDNLSNMGRDLHQGCQDLAARLQQLKQLKLHVFGHLHTDGGKQVTLNNVTYVNAAICTEGYKPTNPPVIVDL